MLRTNKRSSLHYIVAEIIHTVIQYYILDFDLELVVERVGKIASSAGTFIISDYVQTTRARMK
jgi:hypothetical protein